MCKKYKKVNEEKQKRRTDKKINGTNKNEKLYYRAVKSHTTHLYSNENENNKLATEPVYMVEGGDFWCIKKLHLLP